MLRRGRGLKGMEIPILYRDGEILVCIKPVGISSEEGGLPELLREACGGELWCVHRLDRAVGGVMVYARTKRSAAALSAAVAERRLEKIYLAVVQGRPAGESGEMRDLLYHDAARNKSYVVKRPRRGVREAALRYRLLASEETPDGTLSLVRIRLETGRSHQIRVQFASRGLPLVYDGRYGSSLRGGSIALWASMLSFPHPASGERLCFTAPVPTERPWTVFESETFADHKEENLADF